MTSPLDDFNKRTTAGGGSWIQGPPTNVAESAAEAFIESQRRSNTVGGGSIDFGVPASAFILLIGVALFVLGTYVSDNFREAKAMTGLLLVIVSGFMMLVGVGGVVVGCIKNLTTTSGWRCLFFAALAAFAAWWFSRALWMMSFGLVPQGLMPVVAAALVLVAMGGRR
ncbi:hypothetical protein [Alsobacter sp. R-9]